jgi:hypothetical protein
MMIVKTLPAAITALALTLPLAASADDAALQKRIDLLQQQLDSLKAELRDVRKQSESVATQQDKTNERLADMQAAQPSQSDNSFGGYGEATYNRYRNDSSRNQADLRRFVLFFGHRFDDRLSFNSEVEWEHAIASSTDQGEAAVEQAYLDYKLTDTMNLRAGLFLMPFGFINESHEPPTYYGVERNFVETRIIPSTWREGGVSLRGTTENGWSWNTGITTGFQMAKFDNPAAPLAATHQELQFAQAHDLAAYGALNYRGVPGLTVGGALFRGNSGQGNASFKSDAAQPDFSGISAPVTLWDMHARWQPGAWDLQALYARGRVGDADRIDETLQAFNAANGTARPYLPSAFYGWLLQGAYTVWQRGDMSLTPFVRYEKFDAQARMPAGFAADPANADKVVTVGMSFKPHPQVVFKADYQKFRDNAENDRVNLGLGYMF